MSQRYPPTAWAREAERSQAWSNAQRARGQRYRRCARLEWLVIILVLALIIAALVFGIRL